MSPLLKAFFFVMLFLIMAGIGSGVGLALASQICGGEIGDLANLSEREFTADDACSLKILNVVNQLFSFLGAALIFMVIFGKASVNGFLLRVPSATAWLIPLLALLSLPLIQAAYEVNQALIPDESLIASLAKPSEDFANRMTELMLDMPDLTHLLINLFTIAVIPAVCEEIAFRGVLQSQLAKGLKNVHVAIWVSAFVFSFVHFQFYGFIPRLLLGAFFGYLLIHTGSIWAPILAHFFNNAAAVVAQYLMQHYPQVDVDAIENPGDHGYVVLIACVGFSLLFWMVLHKSNWRDLRESYLSFKRPTFGVNTLNAELDPGQNDSETIK